MSRGLATGEHVSMNPTQQPQSDAICPACGHYGYDHLRLGGDDFSPRCRSCECVGWDSGLRNGYPFTASEWTTVTGRPCKLAIISADQLPAGMLTANELIHQTVTIDGRERFVLGAETCRVNHAGRCDRPFGLLVDA
jgi:hypothetical protein